MLPAWSRKLLPLVFIILRYGSVKDLFQKPVVCSQGSHMSLNTTSTVRSALESDPRLSSEACADSSFSRSIYPFSSSSRAWALIAPAASSSEDANRFFRLKRPRSGSRRKCLMSFWTAGERKLPCMVETPFGGCVGMISTPRTRPYGFVSSIAT
jgi:hypothetical protein